MPLNGVVREDWQELVIDDKHGGGINRITYEWCVLTALREKVRCKELWVRGADRLRNPDERIVPERLDARRKEVLRRNRATPGRQGRLWRHYGKHGQGADGIEFSLPNNPKVSSPPPRGARDAFP